MKTKFLFFIIALGIAFSSKAQEVVFSQDFESFEKGKNLINFKKGLFKTWGKSTWKVTEKKGKGFEKSNKFASCGDEEGATLVKTIELEAGSTYIFSVAVKISNADTDWKANYNVRVLSGKKGDIHFYAKDDLKKPKANNWRKHEFEFTVIEGREKISFQVYRWAKDVTLNLDNFKIVKK